MSGVPAYSRVLAIGGGPAGSTASTLLARQGIEATLLESAVFPRYHIGESLLPTILPILDLLGMREEMEVHGFQREEGAYREWGPEQWSLDFGELSRNCTYAYQVERSAFDHLLLEHARSQGVRVIESVDVRSVEFEGERSRRVHWVRRAGTVGKSDETGRIDFEYLVDASGGEGSSPTSTCETGAITRSSRPQPSGRTGRTPIAWLRAGKGTSRSARSRADGCGPSLFRRER